MLRPKIQIRAMRALPLFAIALTVGAALWQVEAAPAALDANDQKVVDRLEWLLKKRIKNPDGGAVAVKVVPTDRASDGYFSSITIASKPAKLKNLYVSEFSLSAQNVKIDPSALWGVNKVRTTKSQTQMRAVISEDDLTRMLSEGKGTKDMKLKVKYEGDHMRVTGNLNYMLLSGPVDGTAKLRQAADHQVFLDIISLKLRGVEVPGFVKNQFSNHINPIIDYKDLPFNPPFKTLKIVGNKAYLST